MRTSHAQTEAEMGDGVRGRDDGTPDEAMAHPPPGSLHERIYRVVCRIPRGRVATYGEVARAMDLRDARRVGWALAALPHGSDVPWHRVVNARGRISARAPGGSGGSGGAERVQRAALEAEGVVFEDDGSIDLGRWGWNAPNAEAD